MFQQTPQMNPMQNMMAMPSQNMMFNQNMMVMPSQNMMFNQNMMMPNQMQNMNCNFPYMYNNFQNMNMQYSNGYMNNMNMAYPGYGGVPMNNNNMMQPNTNSNTTNTTNTPNSNNTSNNQLKGLLSRENKLIGDPTLPTGQGYINVFFEASTGNTVVLNIKDNLGLRDALKLYMQKLGLAENHIGKEIVFLFNGKKLEHESNDPIKSFKIVNNFK